VSRRRWLRDTGLAGTAAALGLHAPLAAPPPDAASAPVAYPPVLPGRPMRFPRDFGAHPPFRTEWWYVTGWLRAGGRDLGVQVTFFRARTGHDARNPSRFAPTQLLLAHAALAIDGAPRLLHDERAARQGFGLAQASDADTDVSIGGWRLQRQADDRYLARIDAGDFALDLVFVPPHPPFPQGEAGHSRKGPAPTQASHYYSRPQMRVDGRLRAPGIAAGVSVPAAGVAWLDHEWSSELLHPDAAGWDWVGLNLDDGSALMAFRIRTRDDGVLWSHARWIGAGGTAGPTPSPRFEPLRLWRSPRTGARWPVAMRLTVGGRTLALQPLLDDQELDTRASTGTVYWEGAVRVLEHGRAVGRGYLELTGYAGVLRL